MRLCAVISSRIAGSDLHCQELLLKFGRVCFGILIIIRKLQGQASAALGFAAMSCAESAADHLRMFTTTSAVLFLLSVFIGSCSAWTCSSDSETALLGFKNGLIDPDGLLDEWVPGTNCCYWPYVTCRQSDGAVIELSITGSARPNHQPYRSKNANSLGSTLADLTELQLLKLQWIFFNSPIPSAWGSFSDNLVFLIVNDCNLQGSIPSNLGDIHSLQRLDLQANFLTGVIPQQLCNLQSLNYLDVSYNNLQSGAIVPTCFQNRPGLHLSTGNQDEGGNQNNNNHATHSSTPTTSSFFLHLLLGIFLHVLFVIIN